MKKIVTISEREDMLEEWDKDKNKEIGLFANNVNINLNMGEKPFWICKNHKISYRQYPKNKKLGYAGCPKCRYIKNLENMQKGYLKRSGTLAEKFPKIANEFDSEKNYPKTAKDFTPYSGESVWWIYDKCKHSCKAIIANRTKRGDGCPICAGKVVLEGFNDLYTNKPDLCEEWCYEENDKLNIKPNEVTVSSHTPVYWKCLKCNHIWKASISDRSSGRGCPKCSLSYQSSFEEQAIYFYLKKLFTSVTNSFMLENYRYDIYIKDINTIVEYDGYYWHKNKLKIDNLKNKIAKKNKIILYRIREKELSKTNNYSVNIIRENDNINSFENSIYELFQYFNKHIDINIKRDYSKIKDFIKNNELINSIYNTNPIIASEWHPTLNGNLTPKNFSAGSSYPAYWQCSKCGYGKNGEWQISISNRCLQHCDCPACNNKVVFKGYNDFKSKASEILLKEWNYKKNSKNPDEYTYKSNESVYWTCSKCNYVWKAKIYERNINGTGCPACSNRKLVKGYNDLKTKRPDLCKDWHKTLNELKPNEIIYCSTSKIYWQCSKCGCGKDGEWQTRLYSRSKNNTGCPACKNKRCFTGINDLATKNKEMTREYSPNNPLPANKVLYGGKTTLLWICPKCHIEYKQSIYNRLRNIGEHKCSKA